MCPSCQPIGGTFSIFENTDSVPLQIPFGPPDIQWDLTHALGQECPKIVWQCQHSLRSKTLTLVPFFSIPLFGAKVYPLLVDTYLAIFLSFLVHIKGLPG